MDEYNKIVEQIKRDEGFRLAAYLDTGGTLTVGYGHNCKEYPVFGVRKAGDRIQKTLAEELLKIDLLRAQKEINSFYPWVERLDYVRYAVLLNMCFNLGITRLKTFKKMFKALSCGNYSLAAKEMLNSKWAKQVGKRSARLAKQMELGLWVM